MIGGKIGIDLGTANCLVWIEGEGIVLEEPTVVAVTVDNNKVVAVGNEAKQMLGRTPESITASRPMRDGVIADYAVTEAMLRYFIQRVKGKSFFFKPEVMICVPAGCTQVEKRAVMDAALSSGAKEVYLIDEPLAAAIGADIPIGAPSGNMIIDIGGGATEAAVISLGSVVVTHSIRMAGNKIDEAIASYVRKKHNLIIGDQTAEEIKLKLASAIALPKLEKMEIKGRDSIMGLPKMVEITSTEVLEATRPVLNQIVSVVKSVLEETPPELASDIIDRGIVMTGGTSLLRSLDKYITEETGVPAHVAEDALKCVINGVAIALQNLEKYKQNISKH